MLLFFTNAISSYKYVFLFTPEKGIRFVQEGQYTQAVGLFTEAIKCDPKDYRWVFDLTETISHVFPFLLFSWIHSDILITGFLGIAPTATVVWSSTLWPSQMLRSPSTWLLIGPKAITVGEVHLWGLRCDPLAYLFFSPCIWSESAFRWVSITLHVGLFVIEVQWSWESHGTGAKTRWRLWRSRQWPLVL